MSVQQLCLPLQVSGGAAEQSELQWVLSVLTVQFDCDKFMKPQKEVDAIFSVLVVRLLTVLTLFCTCSVSTYDFLMDNDDVSMQSM